MSPSAYDIIVAPKTIVWPPKPKTKSHESHRECDVRLECPSLSIECVAFVRVPTILSERFSVGLRCVGEDRSPAVLIRVNGPHAPHPNPDGTIVESGSPHLHTPSFGDLHLLPSRKRREQYAVALPHIFVRLDHAWAFFCETAHVQRDERMSKLVAAFHTGIVQLDLIPNGNDER